MEEEELETPEQEEQGLDAQELESAQPVQYNSNRTQNQTANRQPKANNNQRRNRNPQQQANNNNNNTHKRDVLDQPRKNGLFGKRKKQNNPLGNQNHKSEEDKSDGSKKTNTGVNATKGKSSSKGSISMKPDGKAKITIKMPLKVKIIMYGLLILIPLVALLLFVVIFSDEDQSLSGTAGTRAYGQTCTKVTVTDTENHINDGEVEFEDYVAGVVAAESNGINNIEYLKLLAVLTRTNFFENANSDCTVEGNGDFQNYMDVEDSPNSSLIKQAVSETENMIIVEDEDLNEVTYGYGKIVSEDDTYYYIANSTDDEDTLAIPKSWADSQPISKPSENSNDYDVSLIIALYLITNENYTYQNVIEESNENDYTITENVMILTGVDGFMNPTANIVCTSPFGYRTHPVTGEINSFHGGLDIAVNGPIFAAKSGTVSRVVDHVTIINATEYNYESGYAYGNNVIIDHGDGTATLYAHIKYGTIPDYVYEGATIEQGQQIGDTGSTGRSTGIHLHYEVRVNGEKVDPSDYLDLTNATGTCRK